MKGTVLARVRRVATSPEGRALVHAVDDAGLEYKIEVPAEAVRGVSFDAGYTMFVAWSLHAAPRPAEPAIPPPAAAPAPLEPAAAAPRAPSAIDEEFMALLSRGRRPGAAPTTTAEPASPPATATSPSPARPEQQLAALLGIGASRPPT